VTKNFGGVAVPLAVATLVWWLPYIILSGVRGGLIGAMSASSSVDPTALLAVSAGIAVVAAIVLVISQAYMMGGMTQFALRVARGERPEFGVVFSGGRTFVPMLGATFLAGIGLNIGFALCIVPGLFLMGSWIAYTAFIVDKGMGPVAALSASWQATAPYRVNALVYAILAVLASFAGTLACCVGALLISSPMVMIGNAYIYLKLTGEQPRLAA
jgi:uncharacterized membrane protein